MGAAGALLLLLIGCGTEAAFQDGPSAEVPENLRQAYLEVARARFKLIACRGPEQLQTIGGIDSARIRAEEAAAARFAGVEFAALKQEADRETLVVQIEQCPGEGGIARYRSAVSRLRSIAGEAN